jgi:hypothetical protein
MQLWHWLLLLGLVFLISYNPRTGNLGNFFTREISVEDHNASRETQSDSDTDEHSE